MSQAQICQPLSGNGELVLHRPDAFRRIWRGKVAQQAWCGSRNEAGCVRAAIDARIRNAVGGSSVKLQQGAQQQEWEPRQGAEVASAIKELQQLRVLTAIKTPYNEDGSIDFDAYKYLLRLQVEGGANAVVVAGTTGEGHLMNWEEHIDLIQLTVMELETMSQNGNANARDFKIVGYTGSNCTSEAIIATEKGFSIGMHAALQINPYYGKTSKQGLRRHFAEVTRLGPTIVYNVPSRTNQDIETNLMEELSLSPNFVGVKECVGNERIAHYTGLGMTVWSGNDDQFHEAKWKCQARGVISVVSNLVPGLISKLLIAESTEAYEKLLPLINWLFLEPNPIGLNTALSQLGAIKPVFRLPYVPLDLELRQEFVGIVEKIGREHFVGDQLRVMKDEDFRILESW